MVMIVALKPGRLDLCSQADEILRVHRPDDSLKPACIRCAQVASVSVWWPCSQAMWAQKVSPQGGERR